MAIAFRSATTGVQASAVDTVTVSTPAGVVAGDLLLAFVGEDASEAITQPAGWTELHDPAPSISPSLGVYWKVATASEPTSHTWSYGVGAQAAAGILAYTGVDNASPIVASAVSATQADPTTATAPSVSTGTVTNAMIVSGFTVANGTTWTPGSSMTERFDVRSGTSLSDIATMAQDIIQAASGATGTKSATPAVTDNVLAATVALRPFVDATPPAAPTGLTATVIGV